MDSRDLAAFRRLLDDRFRQLGQNAARIEQSQAALARAYERLARERSPERPRRRPYDRASTDMVGPGHPRTDGLALHDDVGDIGS